MKINERNAGRRKIKDRQVVTVFVSGLENKKLIKETDQLQKLAHAYKHAAEINAGLKNYKAAFQFEVLYKQLNPNYQL